MHQKAGLSISRNEGSLLNDIQPWTGWRLVAAWALVTVTSWAVVYAIGVGLYELILWADQFA